MKAITALLLAFFACSAAELAERKLLERIELVLKPREADKRTRRYLRERIQKAVNICKQGKCKEFEGNKTDESYSLHVAYEECLDECSVKEQRAHDMLKELGKKDYYWRNFESVREGMSLQDAVVYWIDIKSEFQLLEAEQLQLERIERILKPTPADNRTMEELGRRISEREKRCKEKRCKHLRVKLEEGREPGTFTNIMAKYEACMQECKAKENRSIAMFREIEQKGDYWSNFQEVKNEMSIGEALEYWTEIKDEFVLLEEEQAQLERIERILKPTAADEHLREELEIGINKTGKDCDDKKCKTVLKEGKTVKPGDSRKPRAQCLDECKTRQWSLAVLVELEKKKNYWSNFSKVWAEKSLADALVYWTEIIDNFNLLAAEEEKYEAAMKTLTLTKDETALKEKLDGEIRHHYRKCKIGDCRNQREKLLKAEAVDKQITASDEFSSCMKTCKAAVKAKAEQLDKLQEKEDYHKHLQEVREQGSVIEALQHYDDIKVKLAIA